MLSHFKPVAGGAAAQLDRFNEIMSQVLTMHASGLVLPSTAKMEADADRLTAIKQQLSNAVHSHDLGHETDKLATEHDRLKQMLACSTVLQNDVIWARAFAKREQGEAEVAGRMVDALR